MEDRAGQFKGLTPDYLSEQAAIDKVIYDLPLSEFRKKATPEDLSDLQTDQTNAQPLVENPYMQNRRFTGGRETLNMAEGATHYIASLVDTIAHRFVRGDRRLLLADPGLQANPQIRNVARKYLAEVISPTG